MIGFNTTILISAQDLTGQIFSGSTGVPLVGADLSAPSSNNFFTTNTFKMQNMTRQYQTASAVWNGVIGNSSNVVRSFGFVNSRGPPTSIPTPNAEDVLVLTEQKPGGALVQKTVTVISLLNGAFLNGIIG